mgnify:CR=1 FL=1
MTETIYIIELIRASLEQRKAEEKPENILWEKILFITRQKLVHKK